MRWEKWTRALWQDLEFCYLILSVIGSRVCVGGGVGLNSRGMWSLLCENRLELGRWVARSAEHPTLDLGSGHDLSVCEFQPCAGLYADGWEPA